MESSSTYKTFGTKHPDRKRKRIEEADIVPPLKKRRPSTNGVKHHSSDQEGLTDAVSPSPNDSAVQRRPLDDAGSISNCGLS